MNTTTAESQNISSTSDSTRTLRVAYTPDSDDAFNYYAWEHGRVWVEGWNASFHREHIIALNHAAELERFDVVAISSVMYPRLADRYWILAAGNSIGRGYGPVLVSRHHSHIAELHGKRIAVAGIPTTGAALAAMFCSGATLIELPYNQIADAVVAGECDAGVMIHEELLFFPEKGLQRVCDLGAAWTEYSGLPLPVGLNIIRKEVGREVAREVVRTCHRSLEWAMQNRDEAMVFASLFGRGCSQQHVEMFSNEDTLRLAPDVRVAMKLLFERAAELGIGPKLDAFEVIDV